MPALEPSRSLSPAQVTRLSLLPLVEAYERQPGEPRIRRYRFARLTPNRDDATPAARFPRRHD